MVGMSARVASRVAPFAALVAVAVAACGSSSTVGKHGEQSGKKSQTVAPASMLPALFPANAADHNAGMQFAQSETAATTVAVTACLKAAGLPGPPDQLPAETPIPFPAFPDLAEVAKRGFLGFAISYKNPYNPGSHMGASERRAYKAGVRDCNKRFDRSRVGRLIFGPSPSVASLENQWYGILAQIDASAPVLAAGRRAERCAAHHGFPFEPSRSDYVAGFLLVVQGKEAPLFSEKGAQAQAQSLDHRGALALVACFHGYESLRDKLRAKRRSEFFAEDALAIRKAEERYASMLNNLSKTYGVRL